jgi:hypothetical protein
MQIKQPSAEDNASLTLLSKLSVPSDTVSATEKRG